MGLGAVQEVVQNEDVSFSEPDGRFHEGHCFQVLHLGDEPGFVQWRNPGTPPGNPHTAFRAEPLNRARQEGLEAVGKTRDRRLGDQVERRPAVLREELLAYPPGRTPVLIDEAQKVRALLDEVRSLMVNRGG